MNKANILNDLFLKLQLSDMPWKEAARLVQEHKECLENDNIDDVYFSLFVGGNELKIPEWKNKTLLSCVLLYLVWYRLARRSVSWHEGGEILMPKIAAVSKLEVVVGRCARCFREGGDAVYEMVLAILFFAKGDYKEASKVCARVRLKGYPVDAPFRSFFSGVNTFFYDDFYSSAAVSNEEFAFDRASLLEVVSSVSVCLVSCDQGYFEKFSGEFLSTMRSTSLRFPVIFFVIGERDGWEELGNGGYVFYVRPSYSLEPALYASFRYLVAQFIIDNSEANVFVFDIDFLFTEEISDNMELMVSNSDLSLTMHGYGVRSITPWTRVSAPLSYFSNSLCSSVFLSNYVGYWRSAWLKSDFKWWIDQNALFSSYLYVSRCFPSAKVMNVFDVANRGVSNNRDGVLEYKLKHRV
ncbi:hypothetical protein [Salinicola endophyticus]|uniref:Uncharacterized protein n=1 Tax=Salinicola endophyticus TaxID=1949083 RepID=A0AB74UBL8_9GAMM